VRGWFESWMLALSSEVNISSCFEFCALFVISCCIPKLWLVQEYSLELMIHGLPFSLCACML
jgi:hypothetical protein